MRSNRSLIHRREKARDTGRSWCPVSKVTEEELVEAVGRIDAWKAPSPDGVLARLWKGVAGVLVPKLMRLLKRCLSRGEFLVLWKEERMVLLPKPGRSSDSLSAFQPVCLLHEASKLLERLAAARVKSHLSRSVPGLHNSQFSFRRERSTANAVAHIRSLV